MREISSFFSKLEGLYKKKITTSSSLVDIVKECAGVTLPAECLNVKDGVLVVTANSYIKSQLFIKKQKLLERFALVTPHLHIRDIA